MLRPFLARIGVDVSNKMGILANLLVERKESIILLDKSTESGSVLA